MKKKSLKWGIIKQGNIRKERKKGKEQRRKERREIGEKKEGE